MECGAKLGGPILFARTAHAGQINPLLAIAGELSRRGVPDLWFASTDNRGAEVERTALAQPTCFVPCGINDRTKELVDDPAVYESVAEQGPMSTSSFLLAMRWMLDPDRTMVEYQEMLAHIDRVQPYLMVIVVSTISALDVAITRRSPFVLSVPFTPSALFMKRLPWDYPAPPSRFPPQISSAQKLPNLCYQL